VERQPSYWCGQLAQHGAGSVLISLTSTARTKGVRASCLRLNMATSTKVTSSVATTATANTATRGRQIPRGAWERVVNGVWSGSVDVIVVSWSRSAWPTSAWQRMHDGVSPPWVAGSSSLTKR